jgi:hypothetical protein
MWLLFLYDIYLLGEYELVDWWVLFILWYFALIKLIKCNIIRFARFDWGHSPSFGFITEMILYLD